MNRVLSFCVVVSSIVALSACGSGDVTVVAQLPPASDGSSEAQTLRDLEIYLLPYDRDVVFDSLEAAYPEREPPVPDTLLKLQAAISAALDEYTRYDNMWSQVRDSLQGLRSQMDRLARNSAQYAVLFREYGPLEQEYNAAERRSQQAFTRYTGLQTEFASQSQEIRMIRDAWADAAFADIDVVIGAKLKALKRTEMADTTAADGTVRFRPKPGQWWVHARWALPYDELYWNVPINVESGQPLEVRLSRDNAQVRPRL
jgi:hypothetical protein